MKKKFLLFSLLSVISFTISLYPVKVSAQNPPSLPGSVITIEKSGEGNTTLVEKNLNETSISIEELLNNEGLLKELGNLQPDGRLEIIIRKYENASEDPNLQIKVFANPSQSIEGTMPLPPFEFDGPMELVFEERPFLGVYFDQFESASGASVTSVISGTPAEKAGLQAGDIILKVNGNLVTPEQSLQKQISGMKPGEEVTLFVARKDQQMEIKAVLGTKPMEPCESCWNPGKWEEDLSESRIERAWLGISMNASNVGRNSGIIILDVNEDSPAAKMGLQANDEIVMINGMHTPTVEILVGIMKGLKPGDAVKIEYVRDGIQKTTEGVLVSSPGSGEFFSQYLDPVRPDLLICPDEIDLEGCDGIYEPSKKMLKLERKMDKLNRKMEKIGQGLPGEFEEDYFQWDIIGDSAETFGFTEPEIERNFSEIRINITMRSLTPAEAEELSQKSGISITPENTMEPSSLIIFPNPAREKFNVSFTLPESGTLSVRLMDMNGRIISAEQVADFKGSFQKEFVLSGNSAGTYVLHLEINGKSFTRKIVTE